MSLQVWLPLNGENNIIPDISSFKKESNITLTEDTNGWYKVIDSSHTSSRWGVYYDFTVKPGMTYTLQVYSKSTTGIPCSIGIQSFQGGIAWPAVRDTNSTSTEKLTKYTWTASQNDNKARIYLAMNPSSTIANNYVFYKQPRVYEAIIHNQGIANVNVTNNNAVIDDNGKIGKCYSFGTSPSYLTIDSNVLKNYTEFSFACWVNIISWNSAYATIFAVKNGTGISWSNLIFSLLRNGSTSTLCFSISNGTNYTSTNCSTGVLSTGVWYHFVCTYKAGTIKLYQNGVLVKSYSTNTIPAFSSIANLWIGRANSNSYQTNIKLNDVRIYNHCLSEKQIKEISKGLILHYPLNKNKWGNDNLIKNSMFNETPWINAIQGIEFYKNKKAFVVRNSTLYAKTSTGTTSIFPSISFEEGKQYTISFDWCDHLRSDGKNCSLYLRFKYSDGTISQVISPTSNIDANWVHVKMTSTVGKNVTMMTTTYGNGGLVSIANLKLEQGTEESVFCPDLDNLIYNIEYDISGYQNNGSRHGTFTWNSDTPIYNVSTNATGNASTYLEGPILPSTAQTVSLWIKGNKSTNSAIFNDKITGLQIGLLNSLLYVNSKASTKGFTTTYWKNNDWNHVVVVNNDGTRSVYINGAAETQSGAANYYIHQADNFWLWNRSYNNNYPFSGSLSDLRIYVTALSAEDVLSLYNNGAYIDQLNEIHGKVR